MDDAVAIDIIERTAMEQLATHREELTTGQMKVIADQIAREAWRRLKRDLYGTRPGMPGRK